ncbi:hypothetical protein PIB30_067240 [Stylosanthes scabra]|uniref:Uncharacterized protein n=1 Tax=Stylosanthes scabra TaxID=79078 RepID=A0ABU6YM01_9FABA|nr:hypothetical protein [Stylosanthes scabra]
MVVREFYSNFSAPSQPHVFLTGKKIPFSEDDIGRHLYIPYELPLAGEDDIFKMTLKAYNDGELNMDGVFEVIGRAETNWANDPAITTISEKKIDNAILNAKATAWHKLIMENIDSKTHEARFSDLCADDGGYSDHYHVPEYAGDAFYKVREQDIYCPYGDLKGEHPKVRRGRIIRLAQAPPVPPPEQPPPSQQAEPSITTVSLPSATIGSAPEPSLRDVMRYLCRQDRLLRRQGRQLQNTQTMIQQAFPDTVFTGLMQVSSVEGGNDGT